jgi:hypothetical protein
VQSPIAVQSNATGVYATYVAGRWACDGVTLVLSKRHAGCQLERLGAGYLSAMVCSRVKFLRPPTAAPLAAVGSQVPIHNH